MYFYIRYEYLKSVLTKNDYNLLFSNYKMAREIVGLYFDEIIMNETVLSDTVLCQIQDILIETKEDRKLKHFVYMKKPNVAKAILDQIKDNECLSQYQFIRLN